MKKLIMYKNIFTDAVKRILFVVSSSFVVQLSILFLLVSGVLFLPDGWGWKAFALWQSIELCSLTANIYLSGPLTSAHLQKRKRHE